MLTNTEWMLVVSVLFVFTPAMCRKVRALCVELEKEGN